MPRTPSWRAVADSLAQRLQHHVCAGHPSSECDPSDPWCRNRAAYEAYEVKRQESRFTLPQTNAARVAAEGK